MTSPWKRDETLASGQVFEFRVSAALTEQSRGQLHLFLPLSDCGIDGNVHRLRDGAYIPVRRPTLGVPRHALFKTCEIVAKEVSLDIRQFLRN